MSTDRVSASAYSVAKKRASSAEPTPLQHSAHSIQEEEELRETSPHSGIVFAPAVPCLGEAEDPIRLNNYLRADQECVSFDALEAGDTVVMFPHELKCYMEEAEETRRCTGVVREVGSDSIVVRWNESDESLMLTHWESTEPRCWLCEGAGLRRVRKRTLTGLLADMLQHPDKPNLFSLDVRGFHTLLIRTLPEVRAHGSHRIMPHTWKKTKEIFATLDVDSSQRVSINELVSFCNKHDVAADSVTALRPKGWREWLWMFVSPTGGRDTYHAYHAALPEAKSLTPADADFGSDGTGCRMSVRTICWLLFTVKVFSQAMIIVSCVIIMLDSLPEHQNAEVSNHYSKQGTDTTFALDCLTNVWFTIETLGWIISYPYHLPGRVFYLEQETWVNLLSVIPFYVMFMVPSRDGAADGEWVKVFAAVRMARLIRCLKLFSAFRSLVFETDILRQTKAPKLLTALRAAAMPLFWLMLLVATLCVISSTFFFYVELYDASFNPVLQQWVRNADSAMADAGSAVSLQSVPETLYWAVVTLTTVGYGDISPVTPMGKLVASVVMLVSMVLYALPITIIGSTFAELYQDDQDFVRGARYRRDFKLGLVRFLREVQELSDQDRRDGTAHAKALLGQMRQLLHWDSDQIQARKVMDMFANRLSDLEARSPRTVAALRRQRANHEPFGEAPPSEWAARVDSRMSALESRLDRLITKVEAVLEAK